MGFSPTSLKAGDLNGDGRPDLVLADSAANCVCVSIADGSGGFANGGGFPIGPGPRRTQVPTKKTLALAVTTMSIAALGGGIGAAVAQAQNDETLSGTATTTGGATGLCLSSSLLANANFNVAGSAAGPYAGQFTETDASASLSRSAGKAQLKLAIPFTISSGATTITGTITNPKPYAGGSPLCGPSFSIYGIDVGTNGAQYTATIQRSGRPGQTITGTAQINGGFQFRPPGRQTIVTETLLAFPAP